MPRDVVSRAGQERAGKGERARPVAFVAACDCVGVRSVSVACFEVPALLPSTAFRSHAMPSQVDPTRGWLIGT